ncbi:S9 family peptidase [Haloferax mediterranei ATCC 33500]|uniref:Acylaminoacyl-peptidase n=1 Tax=Haloferax mediterranei (strain ATCC 33500 / DSM 1411 / JCM 8866 / NBRC 14739 / NCIMB 2177 / R-4) TaxID=523841 RepID=I3R363_HALMT|nr:S9 family peptidase [Haloferax mediterranei]AFK18673.1 putative acylaminoacyl-peptidase [Haloferax mediterranei ATCC 33500]AHZ21956.1 dipeptidyl aminopeptidase [Haloferax mediterranei ATCC 33500]EMA03466.1 putative acylaminoacyl-peptidase [Haloferax mediterranei ATCC 33500]MDX5988770.1 S9 family peptidase [Haloferax mediterranei ATCC 33500]QCQ75173.1 S9 family peptidase [Haloferax mediterranei ATCC 33500]
MSKNVPFEALNDLSLPTDVTVSPDGDRIAFTVVESAPDEDERPTSLYVVPTDGSREPHRLTRLPGASSPKWSPDGNRLAFIATREKDVERRVGRQDDEDAEDEADADGDETVDKDRDDGDESDETDAGSNNDEPKSQVWCFDLELGGDPTQHTDFDEGVSEFDWSPDGDRLVVSARDPTEEEQEYLEQRKDGGPIETERLQHKINGVGWTDTVTTYLFVVDIETGETNRLDEAAAAGAFADQGGLQPAWGPNDRIAYVTSDADNPDDTLVQDVFVTDPDGSNIEKVTTGDSALGAPKWSPDGTRIAFVGDDPENFYLPREIYVADLGSDEIRSVSASLDRTVTWNSQPQWASDDELYTLIADEGKSRVVRLDPYADDPERVFDVQGDYRGFQLLSIAGGHAGVRVSDPNDGWDIYGLSLDDIDATDETEAESFVRLSALNTEVTDEYEMPQTKRVTFESDGWEVEGIVYAPADFDFDNPDPLPTVVAIHGGPMAYDEPEFRFEHPVFTSRGYLVFRPNYRGGTSYGREFADELHGQWGTVEVDDIVAGVESLADRGWTDPDRVFGYGFSYGGIAQGFLVTQTDLLTAAVPEHGIYDQRSAYGTDDNRLWKEYEHGRPWEDPDSLDAASSITDADNIDTPLLVMAGGQDWRCPPTQSEQLYVAAKAQGVDAKLVVYPDEHHAVTKPERATHRLEQILDWYERHDPAVETDE